MLPLLLLLLLLQVLGRCRSHPTSEDQQDGRAELEAV